MRSQFVSIEQAYRSNKSAQQRVDLPCQEIPKMFLDKIIVV